MHRLAELANAVSRAILLSRQKENDEPHQEAKTILAAPAGARKRNGRSGLTAHHSILQRSSPCSALVWADTDMRSPCCCRVTPCEERAARLRLGSWGVATGAERRQKNLESPAARRGKCSRREGPALVRPVGWPVMPEGVSAHATCTVIMK